MGLAFWGKCGFCCPGAKVLGISNAAVIRGRRCDLHAGNNLLCAWPRSAAPRTIAGAAPAGVYPHPPSARHASLRSIGADGLLCSPSASGQQGFLSPRNSIIAGVTDGGGMQLNAAGALSGGGGGGGGEGMSPRPRSAVTGTSPARGSSGSKPRWQ